MERFPNSKVFNTYGPSESTCFMTLVEVTEELLAEPGPLPIGLPMAGMEILFEEGSSGEMILAGDTVGRGYFQAPDLTQKAFGTIERKGKEVRYFKTGDLGKFENDTYFCLGRLDSQIKLHGFRIELGDIDKHLNDLDPIEKAVVLPHYKDGKVDRLTAFIVLREGHEGNLAKTMTLKNDLKACLPDYMIPSRFVYMDRLPMNQNSKIDRKALGELT